MIFNSMQYLAEVVCQTAVLKQNVYNVASKQT